MAASNAEIAALAAAAKSLANAMKSFVALGGQFLSNNSAQSINWGAMTDQNGPVDPSGDLTGFDFTPAELSNFIGSVDTVRNFITDNGHLGNIEKLANPIV